MVPPESCSIHVVITNVSGIGGVNLKVSDKIEEVAATLESTASSRRKTRNASNTGYQEYDRARRNKPSPH